VFEGEGSVPLAATPEDAPSLQKSLEASVEYCELTVGSYHPAPPRRKTSSCTEGYSPRERGRASIKLTEEAVGMICVRVRPPASRSVPNSSAVRTRPAPYPWMERIVMSINVVSQALKELAGRRQLAQAAQAYSWSKPPSRSWS